MIEPRWRQALPVLLGVQASLGLAALLWGLVRNLPWWERVQLDPAVLAGVLAGLALSFLTTSAFRFLARRGVAGLDWILEEFMGPLFQGLPLAWAVGLSLLSAFCEEGFFRGTLQAEFGLWTSSALFGLLHTGDRRLLLVGLWSTAVGLGLGLAYDVTGNLGVPIAVHAASNFLSFLQLARWQPRAAGEPGDPVSEEPIQG